LTITKVDYIFEGMTILITGTNGNVSSAVLRTLATDPELKVRALVRDATKAPRLPGVEVVVGDLDQPASLVDAFAGVDTLWLLNAMGPEAPHASSNAVWAARQAGVGHLVRLSAIGAGHDAPTRNGRLHALSDLEAQASGIPTTIIRPAFFMQNMIGSVHGDVLYHAFGAGKLSMIDVRDIGDFAARVLTEPAAHAGQVYTITGPASISMLDVAADLTRLHGRPIGLGEITPQDLTDAIVAAGMSRWVADVSGLEYGVAYAQGWGDYTTPDFTRVTGKPGRSFADFARDHVNLLGGA
jgi:uncharacterized protein YbjT (DUF2867 family)